jgi:enoyl-CoA hydratase/carnithine racemase
LRAKSTSRRSGRLSAAGVLNRIAEYRQEAAKLTGEASIALLFHHLSASRLVTIAQIEGRVRAAASEFVLACDMRFAPRE